MEKLRVNPLETGNRLKPSASKHIYHTYHIYHTDHNYHAMFTYHIYHINHTLKYAKV